MEITSIRVEIALISGVTPALIAEKMYTGKVVEPGPATKKVMMKSSRLTTNASTDPDSTAGHNSGSVTRRNTCHGLAYRSFAASSRLLSRSLSRARIGR